MKEWRRGEMYTETVRNLLGKRILEQEDDGILLKRILGNKDRTGYGIGYGL
jgi:hypothetical protein